MTERAITIRRRLPDVLIEIFAVVLGVLLALALNDWREGRAHRQTVQRVHATVQGELAHNRAEVERARAHHVDLLRALRGDGLLLYGIDLRQRPVDVRTADGLERDLRRLMLDEERPVPDPFDVVQVAPARFLIRDGDRYARALVQGDSLRIYGKGNVRLRSARLQNTAWETALAAGALVHMDYAVVEALARLHRLQTSHDETVAYIVEELYSGRAAFVPALDDLVNQQQELLDQYDALETLLVEA